MWWPKVLASFFEIVDLKSYETTIYIKISINYKETIILKFCNFLVKLQIFHFFYGRNIFHIFSTKAIKVQNRCWCRFHWRISRARNTKKAQITNFIPLKPILYKNIMNMFHTERCTFVKHSFDFYTSQFPLSDMFQWQSKLFY